MLVDFGRRRARERVRREEGEAKGDGRWEARDGMGAGKKPRREGRKERGGDYAIDFGRSETSFLKEGEGGTNAVTSEPAALTR